MHKYSLSLIGFFLISISHAEVENRFIVQEKEGHWAKIDQLLDIKPGSVFDFSSMADIPAGKHGYLKATVDGNFVFENKPKEIVRFWGVNLCFSANYLSREQADQLAERLMRSGYNSVRLHHFDRDLKIAGADNSSDLNHDTLDKLDYLFYALKSRGIYINIDLYANRVFTDSELKSFGLKRGPGIPQKFKALFPISRPVYESWTAFARNLLLHRNPYTGLTWAEDPALAGVCPVNEDTLAERVNFDPAIRKQYDAIFDDYCKKNQTGESNNKPSPIDPRSIGDSNNAEGMDDGANAPASFSKKENAAFNRFIYEIQLASDKRTKYFLRSLGVKAPITGCNFYSHQGQSWLREHYDYVDNHLYLDHPKWLGAKWSLPFGFRQDSTVALTLHWAPRGMMPSRIIGRPFAITELRFVRPNRHRAQGGVVMPAYASLQGWWAMYNFEYAFSRNILDGSGVGGPFSLASDPVSLIADRLSAIIFRRADISTSMESPIAFVTEPSTAFSNLKTAFPADFSQIGLITRIGSVPVTSDLLKSHSGKLKAVVVDKDAPRLEELSGFEKILFKATPSLPQELIKARLIPDNAISSDGSLYRSDTGEIELNSKNETLKVVTPRSELFVLSTNSKLSGKRVAMENGSEECSVIVTSVDGKALERSERVLVALLTDTLPDGMTFSSEDRTRLEAWGKLPQLVLYGEVKLDLNLLPESDKKWSAWTVALDGTRVAKVPLEIINGRIRFTAKTIGYGSAQLAFELVRQ